MLLQEELTRSIVTVTNQALYGTLTMANSALYWATAFTPSVSESWSKVGAFVFGTEDETSTPGRMSDSAQAGVASYYYNAIDTIILLVTISICFKMFSLVWRSISAIYQTTVGVIKILKFFASKLGFLANGSSPFGFFRNETTQRNEQDASADDGKNSTTVDPHAKARATAMTQTNSDPSATLQGYPFPSPGQQTFMQSQLRQIPPPPPPPIEYLWYYHNQIARNGMHGHYVPPTPPFAPLPNGANVGHRNVFAARNSDFVFIPARRPPVDGQTQQNGNSNNSNAMNDTNSRLGNVQDPRPPQPTTASKETSNNGNQTANDAAMSIAGGTSIAKESNAVKESNTGDSMPTDSNGNDANAATARAANNDDDDASDGTTDGPSMPRKLRSAPGGWVITRRMASPPAENFFGESWV